MTPQEIDRLIKALEAYKAHHYPLPCWAKEDTNE